MVAESENRAEAEDLVKNKAADAQRHLQMIGVKSGKKQTKQRNLGYDIRGVYVD